MVARSIPLLAALLLALPLAGADLVDDAGMQTSALHRPANNLGCQWTDVSATTGCERWQQAVPLAGVGGVTAMAVDEFGDRVFVAITQAAGGRSAGIIAYQASTGQVLTSVSLPGAYAATYPEVEINDLVYANGRLYAAGGAKSAGGDWDGLVTAFWFPSTGQMQLAWHYDHGSGAAFGSFQAIEVGVPVAGTEGQRLFATGRDGSPFQVMTVALDDLGTSYGVAWSDTRTDIPQGRGRVVAVDPDGWGGFHQPARVFVGAVGLDPNPQSGGNTGQDFFVVAYEQATGALQFIAQDGHTGTEELTAVASNGNIVFAGGYTRPESGQPRLDARLTAFHSFKPNPALDGAIKYSREPGSVSGEPLGECFEGLMDLQVRTSQVVLAMAAESAGACPQALKDLPEEGAGLERGAIGQDYLVAAYQANTGSPDWITRNAFYPGQGVGDDVPFSIALDPSSQRVYVAGVSASVLTGGDDLAVVAVDGLSGIVQGDVRHRREPGQQTMQIDTMSWNPAYLAIRPQVIVSPNGRQVFSSATFLDDLGQATAVTVSFDRDQF